MNRREFNERSKPTARVNSEDQEREIESGDLLVLETPCGPIRVITMGYDPDGRLRVRRVR